VCLRDQAEPGTDGLHRRYEGSQLVVEVNKGILDLPILARHCDVPDVR
jgi:hypothetical protein